MKCELFEDLIPLYVGGDLEPPEADGLRQHLNTCAHCRRMTEDFQASRNWLTGFTVPDFDEASFAKMRASVIGQIERQEKRGRWPDFMNWLLPKWSPRLALAVSAASLVAVTALSVAVYRNRIAPPKTGQDRVSVATGGQRVGSTTGGEQISNVTGGNRFSAVTDRKPISTATGRERRFPKSEPLPEEALNNGGFSNALEPPVTGTEHSAAEATAPEEAEPKEMLRIELQTADPNIRIIWLTPKASSPSNSQTK